MWNDLENLDVLIDAVIHRITTPAWKIPLRTIPNNELVLVVGGTARCTLDGCTSVLTPGDLVCLHPGIRNEFSLIDGTQLNIYCVHFTTPHYPQPLPLPPLFHLSVFEPLHSQFQKLYHCYHQLDSLAAWRTNLCLQQMLLDIFTARQSEAPRAGKMQQMLTYIREHITEEIPLAQLSRISGLQKSALTGLFRSTLGTSPGQYIQQERLSLARNKLLETDLPVVSIAEICGFSDPFYFSRCFKHHFSMSPSAYRKLYH